MDVLNMSEYRRYHFDRYRDGRLMAEGAVAHGFSEAEALATAKGWYSFHDGFKLREVSAPIKTPPNSGSGERNV
jgi:hypothetical protein